MQNIKKYIFSFFFQVNPPGPMHAKGYFRKNISRKTTTHFKIGHHKKKKTTSSKLGRIGSMTFKKISEIHGRSLNLCGCVTYIREFENCTFGSVNLV